MHTRTISFVIAAAVVVTKSAHAQSSLAGPVHPLGKTVAESKDALGSVAAIRALSNGSVLVNDQNSRRVLLLDSELRVVKVVADSTPNTNNAYGGRLGGLIPFRGDSTLFVDPASLSLLVIDADGNIVRTMAAPRPNEVNQLTGGNQVTPGFDARGRLVYGKRATAAPPKTPTDLPSPPDSSLVVRVDLVTRKLDTASFYKIPKTIVNATRDANGNVVSVSVFNNNVLPLIDDWAMMSDGTVAVVRGRDYHVEFIDSTGTMTRGANIPYDWERLTDENKVVLLDSIRTFRERARAQATAQATMQGSAQVSAPAAARSGEVRIETRMVIGEAGAQAAAARPSNAPLPAIALPEASELPDYRPVFGSVSVRPDRENRLWVRTTAVLKSGGGAIYDVIDRSGKRVDRVQVPVGVTIAGFGPGGIVYFAVRDDAGVHLKKALTR